MAFFEGNSMTAGYGSGPDIINSCSINVNKGEIVAILGPNGAGKSTAMKAMLGLLKLKSGSVIIDGKDISSLSPQDRVKSGISFVPQTKNVFPGLTVKENLEIGAFLRNEDLNKIIDEIFSLFPILKEKSSQMVGELSGGQRQRIGIARALYNDPEVLVLDEATSALDSSTERDIANAIEQLSGSKTVFVIAHRLGTVRRCDKLFYLEEGTITASGDFDTLLKTCAPFKLMVELAGDKGLLALESETGQSGSETAA